MENKIYNPASQPKEWLIQHFVVRTKVFDKIFKDIKSSFMKYPEQHYLIQGQRGMGKTTLLLRLKYEIENTPQLNSWLIPIFFSEEMYDLTSLSNLWERLLKYLDNLWNTGGIYYKQTDAFIGSTGYEKKCYDLLISILHDKEKKLIIFFDNFGQLFLDNLKEKEQHRLREILMNCNDIRIVGASAIILHDIHDYSKPFFEFFKLINLEGLNKDETFQLITKLQENSDEKIDLKKNKAKIETLAILTSGVIRTIMLIYEVVLNDQDGSALRDLEIILDRITPLYKHRIDDLPVQQRKIVDVIAKSWDAISTKEMAQNIREDGKPMATKLISAQLQQLEKNNVIEKKQTSTKNHLYQVKERFFNIWYLMRNGDRMDRCRVIWLTKFLETWYTDEKEFDRFIKEHIEHLKSGKYDPGAAITISEALAYSQKLNVMSLYKLVNETSTILSEDQKKSLPDISEQKLKVARKLTNEKKYNESNEVLFSIKNPNDIQNALIALNYAFLQNKQQATKILSVVKCESNDAIYYLGITYYLLLDFEKAIGLLNNYRGPINGSLYELMGSCYKHLKDFPKAEILYEKAFDFKNYSALTRLIDLLVEKEDKLKAEKFSKTAAKMGHIESTKSFISKYDFEYWKNQSTLIDELIDEGIKSDKSDPDYYFYKAKTLTFKGIDIEAYKHCLKADKLSTNKSVTYYVNLYLQLYLVIEKLVKKSEAINLMHRLHKETYPTLVELYLIFIKIWGGDYQTGIDSLIGYLDNTEHETRKNADIQINNIFLLLLAKKQYYSLLKVFNENIQNLKDIFKPTYYALMYFIQNEYPNEYLKMGEELKQPVEDILKRVEEMAITYA